MIGSPVTEWSDDILRRVLTEEKSPGTPLLVAALDELLRRERERCAAECERRVAALHAKYRADLDRLAAGFTASGVALGRQLERDEQNTTPGG